MSVTASIFAPGFFSDSVVHSALAVGGIVAVVAGVVGVFMVMRGQSFTGEALSDVGATGGSAAYYVGYGPLAGFVIASIAASGAIELIGLRRPRGRDLATGIVLGAALGLASLFLYFDANQTSTTGASITILFGSLFVISGSTIPATLALGGSTLALLAIVYRPLLLASVDADLAAARGVSARLIGFVFLLALALAVALSAMTIGAILGTALLVGPAATALRLTKRPGTAIASAVLLGVATVAIGVWLAYDSYYWPPAGRGWPVSFLIVALTFTEYLVVHVATGLKVRRPVLAAPSQDH
ncbi:MAG: metal ABC transporter permease [Acidimicrobiales bacterium]